MSGHSWWPDNDKSSWRVWHGPTYEDKKDAKEYWHKSWTKTWDWGSPTGAIPRQKLFHDIPDRTSDKGAKSHRVEKPEKPPASQWLLLRCQMSLTAIKFIDKSRRCGKDFPRYASTSSWSLKHGFASRDVTGIRISEMCYLGIHNVSSR